MVADIEQEISSYIGNLSSRIRGLRAARGMTRKQLSQHSSISERYLAQLESGNANPSIAVLWRVADAMGIDFRHLVDDGPPPTVAHGKLAQLLQALSEREQERAYGLLIEHMYGGPRNKLGIALIGLRGAGKTTLGRHAAASLSVPFVRLTEVIEELGGMAIGELFSLGGQKAYRRLERRALESLIERREPVIVEIGGSLVSEAATFNLLRTTFATVWVRAHPEDHMNRVIHQGDMRPMEGNSEAMADLVRILAEREDDYRKADHVLATSDRSIEDCAIELCAIGAELLQIPTIADTGS